MVPDDYSAVDALDTVGFPTLKKNVRARRKRLAAQLKPLLKIVYEAANNINAHVSKDGGDSVSADAQSAGEVVSAVKGALETEPVRSMMQSSVSTPPLPSTRVAFCLAFSLAHRR